MRLSEIETKIAKNVSDMEALVDLREKESREFTEDEATRFDALEAETKTLKSNLERERKIEAINKQKAIDKADVKTPEEKVIEKYSVNRAIQCLVRGKVDGLEGELSQEAQRELREAGTAQGIEGVGIPSWMVNVKGKNVFNGQNRDLTSGGTATGEEYVSSDERLHQFGLEIAPKAFGLGVEVWGGLTGNVYVNETGSATSAWEGETDANAETTPATSRPFTLSPTRLGAYADVSKTLLAQTSGAAEQRVKTQLQKSQNRALDNAIFQGSGVAPIPTGILNTSNVNSETSGGTPDRQLFLDMWDEIASDNADFDNLNVVTTTAIYAFLMGANIDTGSGRFLLENGIVNGLGVRAIHSNNMPTDNILLGDFSKFVVGMWGGADLVIDPYTQATTNTLRIVVNQFFDMGCLYPEAFCKVTDATLA